MDFLLLHHMIEFEIDLVPGMVHVTVSPLEDGTSLGWSHVKVPVTSAGVPGTVHVSVLSATDGFPPTPSHDRVRD